MAKRTSKANPKRLHLLATVLTYAAPSANHHGKGDDNDKPLQTITKKGRDYAVISPYAIRDALRRILIEEGLSCNRSRVQTAGAPMVQYRAFPNTEYADDFFFGYCVTDRTAIAKNPKLFPKYDSYGFNEDGDFKELDRLIDDDLPGKEFWLGGEIVRHMSEETKQKLKTRGVQLRNNPQTLLDEVSQQFLGGESS